MLEPHAQIPMLYEVISIGCEAVRQVFGGEEYMPVVVAESLFDDMAVAEDAAKNDMVNLVVKAELKQPIFIRSLFPPIHEVNPARAQVVDDAGSSLPIPQR